MQTLINSTSCSFSRRSFWVSWEGVFTILQAARPGDRIRSTSMRNGMCRSCREYRSVVWDVWMNLKEGKDDAVICWLGGDYFGDTIDAINKRVPEERTHAVRSLLNYFARVYEIKSWD